MPNSHQIECQPTLTECPRCKNNFRVCPRFRGEPDYYIVIDPEGGHLFAYVGALGLRFGHEHITEMQLDDEADVDASEWIVRPLWL